MPVWLRSFEIIVASGLEIRDYTLISLCTNINNSIPAFLMSGRDSGVCSTCKGLFVTCVATALFEIKTTDRILFVIRGLEEEKRRK